MSRDQLPNMTLKPSRLKWIMVLLICLGFVSGCLFIIPPNEDPVMWWGCVGFFGLGAFACIPGLLGVGGLDLDPEGFTVNQWGRKTRRTWRECSEFSIIDMRGGPFVGYSTRTDEAKFGAGFSKAMLGETGMLPERYGMKAQDLADLLNRYRARALGLAR